MLVPAVDSQRRDCSERVHPAAASKGSAREKADGHYAAGLLLQLPAREVRFRRDSMPKI
jgi:hypothetical protein